IPDTLKIIPIENDVMFPHLVRPLIVGGKKGIRVIKDTPSKDNLVGIVTQKKPGNKEPEPDDLYFIGTAATIGHVFEVSTKKAKILLEGQSRIKIIEFIQTEPYLIAKVEEIREFSEKSEITDVLLEIVKTLFKMSVIWGKTLPKEVLSIIDTVDNPSTMADMVAVYLDISVEKRQLLLETIDPQKRLRMVFQQLNREVQLQEVKGKIDEDIAKEMSKTQREFFLREQMKAIQKELGQEDPHIMELNKLEQKMKEAKMPKEVEDVAKKELDRLREMNPASAEYTVSRTYIDYLITAPWSKKTTDNLDIKQAEKILDEDHYDLEKVKERILEFLAVRTLKEKLKGPILCFVGPPGTGKTSLGKSIARALGRKFVRISLGGMRDEAEIRGHRRTYVGALPGRIMQEICRTGSNNPVFMLDEVDKIGADFRGDPASALLEVLDPEQNFSFADHYFDVPFDLSNVLFITTANILDPVQPALKDRMEVISLSGYSEDEKLNIAHKFLIPKQVVENGLEDKSIEFVDESILKIVREHTREAGLRNLEREIASICRKLVKSFVSGNEITKVITAETIENLLGHRKFYYEVTEEKDQIGVVTGLAWTEAGGDIIFVEAAKMKGDKKLMLTGQLGDVMQESAKAALSYIRSNASSLNVNENFYDNLDIHLHVPSGATPKDGPSAGITMCTALLSLLTGRYAKRNVALTGEITLSGRVIEIGGVKEKVLAAIRAGVKTIVLPKRNEKDFQEIKKEIRDKIKCVF
ncbi:MAG: endopeptidase La, partial [Candidatus Scalindua sediminis]